MSFVQLEHFAGGTAAKSFWEKIRIWKKSG
jgi:hypothetical protein